MTKCIRFISACQLLSISFIKIHEYDNEKWLAKLTWKCFAPSLFNLCISYTIQPLNSLVNLCAFFVGDCMQKMQVQTFKISISAIIQNTLLGSGSEWPKDQALLLNGFIFKKINENEIIKEKNPISSRIGLDWLCYLAGKSWTAPRIIFSLTL